MEEPDSIIVSIPTIQAILIKHEMGSELLHLLKLERQGGVQAATQPPDSS